MDKIELDKRDRGNLYREDADNVFALTMTTEDNGMDEAEAAEHLFSTGQRFAYVVIKVAR